MSEETKDFRKTARLLAAVLLIAWLVGLTANNATRPLRGAEDNGQTQPAAPQPAAPPASSGQTAPESPQQPESQRAKVIQRYGSRKPTEKAIRAALDWLARHQMADGSWSLQKYTDKCTDKSCTGPGSQESLSAATAMGALPFLVVGQMPASPKTPFQKTVEGAVNWLVTHQKADGDLSAGAVQQMYSHGLATIALCQCYGMSRDKVVGAAAQRAINFD